MSNEISDQIAKRILKKQAPKFRVHGVCGFSVNIDLDIPTDRDWCIKVINTSLGQRRQRICCMSDTPSSTFNHVIKLLTKWKPRLV